MSIAIIGCAELPLLAFALGVRGVSPRAHGAVAAVTVASRRASELSAQAGKKPACCTDETAVVPLAPMFPVPDFTLTERSGSPLSLYTLYGVIALTGIVVNSAIVLIDAANERLKAGMSVLHAAIYAARRRVVPIIITTSTTVGGLFSLAAGIGGYSLLWGPVAGAIVWGLGVATVLTLFVMPVLYIACMSGSVRRKGGRARPAARYN